MSDKCSCCTCTYDDTGHVSTADPACHSHGAHGKRGCPKHAIEAKTCRCGCTPDLVREAEMLARARRLELRHQFAGAVHVRTTDTPEELAALAKAKTKRAAEAADLQVKQVETLVAAAVARQAEKRRT